MISIHGLTFGSSYLPSELIAAFLYAQLEEAQTITEKRQQIFDHYKNQLLPLEKKGFVRLPFSPPECQHNAHMFYLLVSKRDELIQYLEAKKINSIFHYVPLHTSLMGLKMGYKKGDLPITEDASARIIRLPCYFELTRADQDRVIGEIFNYFKLSK